MTTEKKAKVNKRQSRRRRWFEGGLADSEGGCLRGESRLQKGRVDTSAASWRHADFRHTEHTGLRRGAWARAVWQEATTDCGEDRGPRGPPPPPRLQRHPHRGRRKCIWGRAPGGAPRGSAFPSAQAFPCRDPHGIRPRCAASLRPPAPRPRRARPRRPAPPVPASLPSLPSGSPAPPGFRLWPCAARGPPRPPTLQPSSPRGRRGRRLRPAVAASRQPAAGREEARAAVEPPEASRDSESRKKGS